MFSYLQLLKFKSFELSIRSNDINIDIKKDFNKSKKTSSQPISRVFLKSFIGGYFSLNSIFRPDIGVRGGGYVECTDFDIHVPDLLLEFDEISLKSLLFLVSVLSPSSSVSKSNSSSDITAAGNLKAKGKGKGKRTERTQWEIDLNIDLDEIPKATLRTLLWLEKQSTHSHSDRGARADADARAGEGEGEGMDDDLDYDRLRDLMTKYLLSKKSLEEDAIITNTIKEHSSRPMSNLPETLCDSDSGEDFPDDTHSDSDSVDVDGEEGEGEGWEGEDGSDFQDAAEGKGWSIGQSSIRRVKMGQVCSDVIGDKKGGTEAMQDRGRRKISGSASRTGTNMDMSMSHSVYGAKSMATMDSGMFHSTLEGSSSTTMNKGNLTGSTESGFSRKIHKETRIRMHLAVVKVRLRDLAVPSNTHDHVSTDNTTDVIAKIAEIVPLSASVTGEARGADEDQGGEGDKVGEGEVEKNTDAVSSIPTIPSTQPSLPPSMQDSRPSSARVIVRELILRMDSVIISTTLSHEGNGQRTSSDSACDCPEVSFSAGTVDASENTVSYTQDYGMQPIKCTYLSSIVNETAEDTQPNDHKDNNSSDYEVDEEAESESPKNAEHIPTISAFPYCDTREENRIVLSSLSFLSFQTLVDEPGDGEDGVSGAQTSSRARTLISAPHVEGTFKFCPATHIPLACARTLNSKGSMTGADTLPITTRSQPTIALDIRLEPLVLSVRHRTVHRWKSILDDVMGTLPPTKSHTKMTLQLNVPVVDLFVHCDPHFYPLMDTGTSQYSVSSDGCKGSESSVGQGTAQGTGQGRGTEGEGERVISGIEELLAALNISPWSKLLTFNRAVLE